MSVSNSEETAVSEHDYSIDFILSILYASLKSFKGDSLLKPLPDFVSLVEELVTCHDEISFPPLSATTDSLQNCRFIEWITFLAEQISVRNFNLDSFLDFVGKSNSKQLPNYIVELENPRISEQFERLTADHGVSIGFHGTHTENVFSIMQNGLVGHLNKRALFGPGTYLSSDLDVALSFAKQGKSWPLSQICQNMKCVLVCKVINSDQVKQGKAKLSGISLKTDSLPHNYYVVENNDHLIVTHLLVYSAKPRRPASNNSDSPFLSFIRCYGFALFYGMALVFICLGSNGVFKKWMKKFI